MAADEGKDPGSSSDVQAAPLGAPPEATSPERAGQAGVTYNIQITNSNIAAFTAGNDGQSTSHLQTSAVAPPAVAPSVQASQPQAVSTAAQASKIMERPSAKPLGASPPTGRARAVSKASVQHATDSHVGMSNERGVAPPGEVVPDPHNELGPGLLLGRDAYLDTLHHFDVEGRFNLCVRGIHGVGKTTLVNALLDSVHQGRRAYYINFQHPSQDDGTLIDSFLPRARRDATLADRIWTQIGRLQTLGEDAVVVLDEFEALLHHMSEDDAISLVRRWRACRRGRGGPFLILILCRNWFEIEEGRTPDSSDTVLTFTLDMKSAERRILSAPHPKFGSAGVAVLSVPPLDAGARLHLICRLVGNTRDLDAEYVLALGALSGGIPHLLRMWVTMARATASRRIDREAFYRSMVRRADGYWKTLWGGLTDWEREEVALVLSCRLGSSACDEDDLVTGMMLGGTAAGLCWWLGTAQLDGEPSELVARIRNEIGRLGFIENLLRRWGDVRG